MTGYLEKLEDKRHRLNREAEAHRKKRDRLNQQTKKHAEKRDELNAEVKKLLKGANRYKDKRDELNAKVQEHKSIREGLTKEYNSMKSQLDQMKRKRGAADDEKSLQKIKKEIRGLEFKQQTQVLETDKERGVVERIAKLKNEVRRKEDEMEANEDFRDLLQDVREAKRKMDEAHQKVNEYADLAQKEHDQMIESFSKSDKIRKEADRCQEKFVESKIAADAEHKSHIDMIHLVHDFDKIIYSLKQKRKTSKKDTKTKGATPGVPSGKVEAEKIYERFKKGEKISTEDLMMLQKFGFL